MTTFASFERLSESFKDGSVTTKGLTKVIIDGETFSAPEFDFSGGLPTLMIESDAHRMTFHWNPSGAVFVPSEVTLTALNESTTDSLVEEECAVCPILSNHAMLGAIRLQVKYDSVESPELHLPPTALMNLESHPTTKKMVVDGKTVYLYEDTTTRNLIVPTLILDDGSVLHNTSATIIESSCPFLVLPHPGRRS